MSKICVQCNSKIGFFKTPIEAVYCSYDCRNDARAEADRAREENLRLEAEARQKVEQAAEAKRDSDTAAKAEVARRSTCPKCGSHWGFVQGGGALGVDVGDCATCGYSAEFVTIEDCPSCHSHSFVVQADESGRCPRCKFRNRYTRLTA